MYILINKNKYIVLKNVILMIIIYVIEKRQLVDIEREAVEEKVDGITDFGVIQHMNWFI